MMKSKKLFSTICGILLLAALSACRQQEQTEGKAEAANSASAYALTPEPTLMPVLTSVPGTIPSDASLPSPAAPVSEKEPSPTASLIPEKEPSSAASLMPEKEPSPTIVLMSERALSLTMEPGFKEYIAYREISPREGITVYINEKKLKPEYSDLSPGWAEQPEVIIRAGGRDYVLDCEYNLDFGDPIVMFKEGCYAGMECDEILSIALPVKALTDALSPSGAYEVYGREYVLDYQALAEGKPAEAVERKEVIPGEGVELEVGFRVNEEGKRVFALSVPRWSESSKQYWREGIFWYPGLELPEQENYSIFYEELSHFTDSGMGCRRVGIAAGNQMICLGKFCNGVFFSDEEKGYYDEHWEFDLEGGPGLQAWQPRPLEPEALLDLDGDGIAEKLSCRMIGDTVSSRFIVTINGVENALDEYRTDDFFGNCMFTASLDGKTIQLMVFHLGPGANRLLTVYSYLDGSLRRAGQIENADCYSMTEKDGRWLYSVFKEVYALQNDMVMLDYGLIDGILQEIPQEYYEFLMYRNNEDGEPGRNVLTVKQDFELYAEKDGEETFILPQGSHVVTLGGDLADWILVENRDTKERGWLRVKGKRDSDGPAGFYSTFTCVRSDGTEVDVEEVLEGMLCWG